MSGRAQRLIAALVRADVVPAFCTSLELRIERDAPIVLRYGRTHDVRERLITGEQLAAMGRVFEHYHTLKGMP